MSYTILFIVPLIFTITYTRLQAKGKSAPFPMKKMIRAITVKYSKACRHLNCGNKGKEGKKDI